MSVMSYEGSSAPSTPQLKLAGEEEEDDDEAQEPMGKIEAIATTFIILVTMGVVIMLIYKNLPETGVKKIYA